MKKLKCKLEIEIIGINIKDNFYTISYQYRRDGGRIKKKSYENDFSGQTGEQWKKELEKGEALNIVLDDIINS